MASEEGRHIRLVVHAVGVFAKREVAGLAVTLHMETGLAQNDIGRTRSRAWYVLRPHKMPFQRLRTSEETQVFATSTALDMAVATLTNASKGPGEHPVFSDFASVVVRLESSRLIQLLRLHVREAILTTGRSLDNIADPNDRTMVQTVLDGSRKVTQLGVPVLFEVADKGAAKWFETQKLARQQTLQGLKHADRTRRRMMVQFAKEHRNKARFLQASPQPATLELSMGALGIHDQPESSQADPSDGLEHGMRGLSILPKCQQGQKQWPNGS